MIAIALYVISLAGSSAVVALFVYRTLAAHGYPMAYDVAVLLVVGTAAGFAGLQCLYLAAVQLLKPARGGLVYVGESLSQLAALVLVPALAEVAVPWPHPVLARVAPLLFLAAFAGLHLFFKGVSLFCALQSVPASPLRAVPWAAASAVLFATGAAYLPGWGSALDASRPPAPEALQTYEIDGQHAAARSIPESAIVSAPVTHAAGRCLTLRWALPPGTEPRSNIYVSLVLRSEDGGAERMDYRVRLTPDGWATLRVPHEDFPERATRCEVMWTAAEEPAWRELLGLRPILNTGREVLLSGPFEHLEGADSSAPNLVVLLVDALGQADLARAEAAENVAPRLLQFGYQSVRFRAAQSPAPESPAAVWSVLTGNGPLRHGVLGSRRPGEPRGRQTLAEVLRASGVATAAFTQGGRLSRSSALAEGFEVFDDRDAAQPGGARPAAQAPAEASAQSAARTLERAWDWIEAHQDVRFLAVVRLADLAPVAGDPDAYRDALGQLDEQAGWFLRRLRDEETRRNTLVALAGTYGTRQDEHEAYADLPVTEASVHVPLFIYARWLERGERSDPVSLVDLGPTLLERVQARFTRAVEGEDIMPGPLGAKPVSVAGDPLVMTLRTEGRRLYWPTGVTPFAGRPADGMPEPDPDDVLFFDVDTRRRTPRNLASRLPVQVRIGVDILQRKLEDHFDRWPGKQEATD